MMRKSGLLHCIRCRANTEYKTGCKVPKIQDEQKEFTLQSCACSGHFVPSNLPAMIAKPYHVISYQKSIMPYKHATTAYPIKFLDIMILKCKEDKKCAFVMSLDFYNVYASLMLTSQYKLSRRAASGELKFDASLTAYDAVSVD